MSLGGGVMVSALATIAIDREFDHIRVKPSAIILAFVASQLNTQHLAVRAKTLWIGIKIMCPSRTICLSSDCCFSELELKKC